MLVDQARMGQRLLAVMLARGVIGGWFERRFEPVVQDVKRRDDALEDRRGQNPRKMDKSFLVLFFKKEQLFF